MSSRRRCIGSEHRASGGLALSLIPSDTDGQLTMHRMPIQWRILLFLLHCIPTQVGAFPHKWGISYLCSSISIPIYLYMQGFVVHFSRFYSSFYFSTFSLRYIFGVFIQIVDFSVNIFVLMLLAFCAMIVLFGFRLVWTCLSVNCLRLSGGDGIWS